MRPKRRNAIVYAARIWREGKPDLSIRGTDLGDLRKRATKKLRQHLSQRIHALSLMAGAGLADPLALVLIADRVRVKQDPWGGALRYKGRAMDNGWGASYHIVVD